MADLAPTPDYPETSNDRVQDSINHVLERALTETLLHGKPSITLKQRPKGAGFFINPTTAALEMSEPDADTYKTYSFPGKDAHEAWRFTVAIRILAIIAEALHSRLVISKRDIYYYDPTGFGSQRVVDNVIEDIAHTIGVDRSALNVEAAAKGLTVGCYRLKTKSHSVIDTQGSTEDVLIPRVEDIDEIDISGVDWVLILEKEAVFHRLARSGYHTRTPSGKGILITGKGYPDICTRAFVRRLSDITSASSSSGSAPRFYILVDGDPDGMAIMSTYKYGSKAHARENAKLNVPHLHWLGLRMSDVIADADPEGDDASVRMSARDRKKAVAMLDNSPVWAVDGPEPEWRVELQRMLMLNLKAEIEIVYDREGGLEGWIDRKMSALSSWASHLKSSPWAN